MFVDLSLRAIMAGSSTDANLSGQGTKGPSSKPPPTGNWAKIVSSDKLPIPAAIKMNLSYVQPVILEGRPKVVTAADIVVEGAK